MQSLALPTFPPGPKLRFPWWQIRSFSTGVPNFLSNLAREYGDIARFSVGGQAYYLLNHPNYIQDLFGVHREKLVWVAPFITRSLFKISIFEGVSLKKNKLNTEQNKISWESVRDVVQKESENWHAKDSLELQRELVQITKAVEKNAGIAGVLTWAIYLLMQHPSALLEAENEVDAILGGRNLKKIEASGFSYIRMVFAETLRLYPQNWLISQKATESIEIGTYIIPRGAILLVSQWVMHHDLRYYPLPYKFDPLRWRAKARMLRPPMAYFPFQSGVFQEKGQEARYWQIQILLLAALLENWRFEFLRTQKITPDFSSHLRPKEELWVKPKAR